jgi:AraC-like DNA-binding protein
LELQAGELFAHDACVIRAKEPTHSAALLRPLGRLLRARPDRGGALGERIDALIARGGRIAHSEGRELLDAALALTGDPDIGLRAAMFTQLGDFEALEWVTMSAETWRAATLAACRYARILNDAADYRLDVLGDRAHLMLGSTAPLVRAAADFQIAAYHLAIRLRVPEEPVGVEVWFKHEAPADLSAYRAIFPTAGLVFGAAFDGFVSDASNLDNPLPTANAPLHGVLRDHADRLLEELAPGDSLVERVSADILAALREGTAAAERTAARLGMTRRTLTRRLALSNTSYSELLKETRYRTALHYLRNTNQSVEDIAFLLGFSECPPFVRAFKRWSGYAPLEYRKRQRRAAS